MKVRRNINWWCLISLLLFGSCKKELNSDFDPVIGTWSWYKTNKNIYNNNGSYLSTSTWIFASNSSDQFTLEILKKGIVKMYKNGSLERKYRIKDYKSFFEDNMASSGYSYWTFKIELNKDFNWGFKYYIPGDSLTMGFFPYNVSNYQGTGFTYENVFTR